MDLFWWIDLQRVIQIDAWWLQDLCWCWVVLNFEWIRRRSSIDIDVWLFWIFCKTVVDVAGKWFTSMCNFTGIFGGSVVCLWLTLIRHDGTRIYDTKWVWNYGDDVWISFLVNSRRSRIWVDAVWVCVTWCVIGSTIRWVCSRSRSFVIHTGSILICIEKMCVENAGRMHLWTEIENIAIFLACTTCFASL